MAEVTTLTGRPRPQHRPLPTIRVACEKLGAGHRIGRECASQWLSIGTPPPSLRPRSVCRGRGLHAGGTRTARGCGNGIKSTVTSRGITPGVSMSVSSMARLVRGLLQP